ncbi:hypothetical protein ACM40_15685 [Chryseobacterium sp. BLS98]|uniref:TRAFAC clade GTPase domain-containing protein n=1 Tax=Chryseobacterium sp. BLS98 TaxID=885586 RepID=UPI00065AA139|nr:hypothetical protein [Chryseobacterium sp. BLS98]KMQ61136.1 hypothetical protein ACM40_15685 [Chryseobacterium sp. BLS98]
MEYKCSNPDCIPESNCHEGKETYEQCEYWKKANYIEEKKSNVVKQKGKNSTLPWTGNALSILDLSKITYRSTPVIIGVVGKADAGKTTFLAMLYTLMLKGGSLTGFKFCGTKTIHTWDSLYQTLLIGKEGVKFPDPTPAEYIRFLHLALRNEQGKLKDILISDVAGEVFSAWSKNRKDTNAENARWIYENSNAFILFIDCKDLIERKAQGKNDVLDLAQMLNHDLHDRPVIAVWSKSDIKQEIHSKIVTDIKEELAEKYKNFYEIEISNFSVDDPDILVHKNNLSVIDWILSKVYVNTGAVLDNAVEIKSNDYFLKFKKD